MDSTARLALVALLLLAPAAARAQFSTGDLAGTWSIFSRFDTPGPNEPGETRGTVVLDAAGNFTGGFLLPLAQPAENVTGGSLSVTPDGNVSGTLTTDVSSNALADLQLDLAADLVVGTDTHPTGSINLIAAVRRSGSFSEADLAGNWYLYTHWDELLDPHDPGWTRAEITVDAFGTVTNTVSVLESNGGGDPLDGVDFNIDAAGTVTVSVPAFLNDGNLQMTPDKQTIFGVINDTDDFGSAPNLILLVRVGAVATTADLEGTWIHLSFSDRAGANAPQWTRSVFTLDAQGNAVEGSKTDSDGGSAALTSGSLAVDGNGLVDGTLSYGALLTDRFVDAKLNASADLFAGVASGAGGGDDRRIVSIAVLPEPAATAAFLAVFAALCGLSRRRPA